MKALTWQGVSDGRGPDAVLDAVGMEAHGSPVAGIAHKLSGLLPDALAQPLMQQAGVSKLSALYAAIEMVRRGGTISLSGVYGGAADPLPTLLPLAEEPRAYEQFQKKQDGMIKVVFTP